MTRGDIIRMARDAGLSHFYDSEGHCSGITDAQLVTKDKQRNDDRLVHMLAPFAALVAAAERERVAAWMIDRSYTTGHGETIEDLLVELEWQVRESEREPLLEALTAICAKCRSNEWGPDTPRKEILNWMHDHASAAIRARGQA